MMEEELGMIPTCIYTNFVITRLQGILLISTILLIQVLHYFDIVNIFFLNIML